MPTRSWLLLLLGLLACDEVRNHVVTRRVPYPTEQGGAGSGGEPTTPEPDAGDVGGMNTGGAPSTDAGNSAGASGAGSAGAAPTCVPLLRKPWTATANPSSLDMTPPELYNPPLQAVDGDLTTRWSTGREQAGGEWIEIDFGHPVTLTRLELDHKADRNDDTANPDFPAELLVSMSEESTDFTAPVIAEVPGTEDFTMVNFSEPATGRFLLLQQGGTKTRWWSIHELNAVCDIPVPAP